MKKIILILTTIASLNCSIYCQDSCNDRHTIISQLQINSNSILKEEDISLSKRILRSENIAKQALKIAYQTIEKKECDSYDYSNIVDQIIDLELKFGDLLEAEEIAFERLEKLNPNWQDFESQVNPEHLAVLSRISSLKSSDSFYKRIRRNKGMYIIPCSPVSHENEVATLLWNAGRLLDDYGSIYSFKFLQNSVIIINEDNEIAKPMWDKIYGLLIFSIHLEHKPFKQILKDHTKAEILEVELNESEYFKRNYGFEKSKFYFELCGTKIYFKTESCPDSKNRYKRCQPTNLELKKSQSQLLKTIIKYAS